VNEWEKNLPPRLRDRLAQVGELSAEERERLRDNEEIDRCCAQFMRGELEEDGLYLKLKAYEQMGRQKMLKQARERLAVSAPGRKTGLVVEQKPDGLLSVRKLSPEELKRPEGKVLSLDAAGFESAVKANPRLVVDCWAGWCAPCKMMAPVFEELASEYAGRVTFAKLDVDENQAAAQKYQVMSIPTLLMFKDGKLADRITGALPKAQLATRLEAAFPPD
jgi:thioredoxin 1